MERPKVKFRIGASYKPLWEGKHKDKFLALESRRGCGKTRAVLTHIVARALNHPKTDWLLARSTRTRLSETVLKTLEEQVFPLFGLPVPKGGRLHRELYELPNGSHLMPMGLDDPNRGQSLEIAGGYVAEAVEIESGDTVTALAGAMRQTGIDYHQMLVDFNPGAPGHWANKVCEPFEDSDRAMRSLVDYRRIVAMNGQPAPKGRWKRIVTHWADNPAYFDPLKWEFTPAGQSYIDGLGYMSGWRRARWMDGLWTAQEGGVFAGDFQRGRNVIRAWPHGPPEGWPVWVYFDPGRDHPLACNWYTKAPSGKRICFHELYGRQIGLEDAADGIKRYNREKGVRVNGYFLDPRHGFSSTFQSTATIAEQFKRLGLDFMEYGRFQGKGKEAAVENERTMLIHGDMLFTDDCVMTIEEHETWAYKRLASGEQPQGDDQYEDRNNHAIDNTMAFCAAGHKRDEPVVIDSEDEARRWFVEQERLAAAGPRGMIDGAEDRNDLGRE